MAHKNRYLEGMEDGQMTQHRYPKFYFYIKNLHFFILRTDGQMDGQRDGRTEKLIQVGLGNPYQFFQIHSLRVGWRNLHIPGGTTIQGSLIHMVFRHLWNSSTNAKGALFFAFCMIPT